MGVSSGTISSFVKHHYRHFNSAVLVDAADAYNKHLAPGGKMFITLAGAKLRDPGHIDLRF